MLTSIRRLTAPFVALAFLTLANGFFSTYTSLRLKVDGVDTNLIGLISSSYFFGFLLGSLRVEKLISRIKHIRAFAVFAALLGALLMLQGLFLNPYAWLFIRCGAGASMAALYVVIESWFLVVSPERLRGRILAMYMVALYGSQSFSQFFIDFIEVKSLEPFLFAGLMQILSILPVALTKTSIPELENPEPSSFFQIFRHSPFGVTGCLIAGVLLSTIYSLMPVYAYEQNLSVSLLMFLIIAGGCFFQWPLGTLSDIFDRRRVLFFTSAFLLVPTALMASYVHVEWIFMFVSFFFGGILFAIYPISMAQVCDRLKSAHVTAVTGVLVLVYGLGAIFGPLIAPFFMEAFPDTGIFLFIALITLLFAFVGGLSFYLLPPVPLDMQRAHTFQQPLTPLTSQLESVGKDEIDDP